MFCITFSWFSFFAYAQKRTYAVHGKITNASNISIPYSTIILRKEMDSTVFSGCITDSIGRFKFHSVPAANYYMTISSIGYHHCSLTLFLNQDTLLVVSLKEEDQLLNAVDVMSKQPLLERKADRTIINIQDHIMMANENVLDIFKMVPGVLVDGNENISLNGKEDLQIRINDKVIYATGDQLKSILKSLSSNQVKKIELITNPSSKYDAQGSGIINIQLKKKQENGINGNVFGRYGYARYSNYNTGFSVYAKQNKITFTTSYSYFNSVYFTKGIENRRYNLLLSGPVYFDQQYEYTSKPISHYGQLGIDWDINSKQVLGFSIDGTYMNKSNPYLANTYVYSNSTSYDSLFTTHTRRSL